MVRKWVGLAFVAGSVAGLGAVGSRAGDDEEKSPLAKLMVKVDAETKAIREASASPTKFKKAGKEKVVKAARNLVDYGKQTRPFTEPCEAMKKPIAKWNDMTDSYIAASQEMVKAGTKGDLQDIRKAFTGLNNTCTNCHGAFRPKTGDDF